MPEGVTVFNDTVPAVTKLDPYLLRALRRAASEAAGNGIQFYVNSGWRSPKYQEQLLSEAISKYGSEKAYVTGLSAGGAMTAVMLATYPDLFEAGAVFSGIAYDCATSQIDAYSCMSGKTKTADQWAALEPKTEHPPRVSIWQGDADWTVRPANADDLVQQWAGVNGIDTSTRTDFTVRFNDTTFDARFGCLRARGNYTIRYVAKDDPMPIFDPSNGVVSGKACTGSPAEALGAEILTRSSFSLQRTTDGRVVMMVPPTFIALRPLTR